VTEITHITIHIVAHKKWQIISDNCIAA